MYLNFWGNGYPFRLANIVALGGFRANWLYATRRSADILLCSFSKTADSRLSPLF
jgi:hypothetical protein